MRPLEVIGVLVGAFLIALVIVLSISVLSYQKLERSNIVVEDSWDEIAAGFDRLDVLCTQLRRENDSLRVFISMGE